MSNNLHELGQDAGKLAQEHVIDPAMNLIQDAKAAVQDGATHSKESLSRLCHAAGKWISANPFTSVGLAVLAGAALTSMGRPAR